MPTSCRPPVLKNFRALRISSIIAHNETYPNLLADLIQYDVPARLKAMFPPQTNEHSIAFASVRIGLLAGVRIITRGSGFS